MMNDIQWKMLVKELAIASKTKQYTLRLHKSYVLFLCFLNGISACVDYLMSKASL